MTTPNHARPADIGGQDKVLAALAALGQATARQIADHAGLGYSTVTKRLRKLAEAGTVHKQPAGTGPHQLVPGRPGGRPRQPARAGQSARARNPARAGRTRPGRTRRQRSR